MKTTSTHDKLNWAACLLACLPYTPANAVIQYSVTDLGSLGGTYSQGLGVNNTGLAVGLSYRPDNVSEHAIVGDGLAAPLDLGTLGGLYSQAYGINNLGHVVGSTSLSGDVLYHGFKWQGPSVPPLTPLIDLKPLIATGYSRAFSINDSGLSTGISSTVAGTEHAVRWSAVGVIVDLGTLNTGNIGNSYGVDINLSGQVAGYSSLTGNKFTHGVLWNANGTKVDLGTLGGNHSAAYAINVIGDVVGSSTTARDAAQHAFVWQPGQVPPMKDIGTLGGTFSEGYGISSVGDVVGYSTTANDAAQRAFLWQNGIGLQDLNTLIDPVSGWALLEAHAISDDGAHITGIGSFNGQRHAFLLTRLVIDATPPQVSFQTTPAAPNASGWFLTSPRATWSVLDPESVISSKVGCVTTAAVANTAPAGRTFSCTATSEGGTTGPVTAKVKVDTTLPTLSGVPAAFTQQATSTAGAVVNYTKPTATDTFSGVSAAGVNCLPASGSAFAMGATTVNCSVKDNAGNNSSASFVVTVADQTPPQVVFNIAPATPSASGWYLSRPATSWSVTDPESAISTIVGCTTVAAQGNTVPAGRKIICTATSAGGTTGSVTFTIKVDNSKPILTGIPTAFTQAATGSTGAVVNYTKPTATDTFSGVSPAGVSCLPASGSVFPMGATTVNCSVKDNAGNRRTASFIVTVTN